MHIRLLVFIALLTYWFLCFDVPRVQAQDTIVWSQPKRLSDPDFISGTPAIATDLAGNVHVMWSQTMTDARFPSEGDTLFYRRWTDQTWTEAVDVLAAPDAGAQFPSLAVSSDGVLHAVWTTGGQGKVMYAQAPACCADSPQNWSKPTSLGGPAMSTSALVVDNQGRIHVAFAPSNSQVIVYMRSDDGGRSWLQTVEIPSGATREDEYTTNPRLAVDGSGRVHLVWIVEPWPGRFAMYAQSADGGDTWSPSRIIDRFDSGAYASDEYGPEYIDVEVKADEVHLIWDGAPTVERNHIWSGDGGTTWSEEAQLLFPEITRVGRAGWNDMVFDSAGTLHAVSLDKPLHASWSGERWSASDDVSRVDEAITAGGEWVSVAVGLGNQLHVVWIDKFKEPYAVWHAWGVVDAPDAPVVKQEAGEATTPAADLVSPATTPEVTATQASPLQAVTATPGSSSHQSRTNGGAGIVAGLIAALVVVGSVFILSLRRRISNTNGQYR